ncbi:MAG: hypothetical protein JXA91_01955 [Candidatus Thermoplasmatota archaeon]|nr:hypothetical protein [Candidatus Thermoplasmatota archaeon]
MEIINYIYIKNGKIYLSNDYEFSVETKKFITDYDKDKTLYVIDYDGIGKNRPNVDIYQRLSSFSDLWIDGGPRSTGDVVDFVMAGANKITIRKDIGSHIDILHLRELTECNLYLAIEESSLMEDIKSFSINAFDGTIVMLNEKRSDVDFISLSYLKNLAVKNNIYLFNSQIRSNSHWEKIGISGIFAPMARKTEV